MIIAANICILYLKIYLGQYRPVIDFVNSVKSRIDILHYTTKPSPSFPPPSASILSGTQFVSLSILSTASSVLKEGFFLNIEHGLEFKTLPWRSGYSQITQSYSEVFS